MLASRLHSSNSQLPIPRRCGASRPRVSLSAAGRSLVLVATLLLVSRSIASDGNGDQAMTFFESQIRPVLVEHCYECHSTNAKEAKGGLLLDSRAGLAAGGDSGPAIDLEHANKSLLLNALRHQDLKMPPSSKLPDSVADDFEKWIGMGSPDPRELPAATTKPTSIDWNQAKQFWSFQPRADVAVPSHSSKWPRGPIDVFIDVQRTDAELRPASEASPITWFRRLYIDLLGIPPTLDEIDAFEQDDAPNSYDRVVDRLLASPGYGERWGRYWLDLARYADSNGADENHKFPVAWRYRDYVVQAFDEDLPYDRFITEQLAGDLLPAANEADQCRLMTATGFLVVGPKMLAEQDKPKLVADIVDEQVDTISKVFLGLTMGCARCHDHKFDPILAKDYYALASILHSTQTMEHLNHVAQWNERELPNAATSQTIETHQRELDRVQSQWTRKKQEYQDRAFEWQLGRLVVAMERYIAPGTSAERVSEPDDWKWNSLVSESASGDANEVFVAWHSLTKTVGSEFAVAASEFWVRPSIGDGRQKSWNDRLRKQPAPQTANELVQTYRTVLLDIWEQVRDAKRKENGKLEDTELAKLHKWYFESGKLFVDTPKIEETLSEKEKSEYLQLKSETERLVKSKPALPRAMAVRDAPVRLVAIHVRGNHLQMVGDPIPPAPPTVLQTGLEETAWKIADKQSGRLELARWLTDRSNPLTARVMANRIWQGHFGTGLVQSGSNFGFRGQPPTHPELLDWLANQLVDNHWSLKHLHRQIVLSATYRMSSRNEAATQQSSRGSRDPETVNAQSIDPENRWLWRQNPRRLDIESLRDSLLAIVDTLDKRVGGESQNATTPSAPNLAGAASIGSIRRTLYLEVNRAAMSDFLTTFDYVEPGVSVDRRPATIVPHQALFLMNHPLPLEIGKQLATQIHTANLMDSDRLIAATRTLLGRPPTASEQVTIQRFLKSHHHESTDDGSTTDESKTWESMQSSLDAWVSVCRSLLLTNEFLYVE